MKSTSFILAGLFALFLTSCETKDSEQTNISGNFTGSNYTYVVISKLESVPLKKYVPIDTLYLDEGKQFSYNLENEPGIYQLKTSQGQKIDLAINDKEQIQIIKAEEGFSVIGSIDTDKLNAYETFRKESLERLVQSVRREIRQMTKDGASEKEIIAKRALEVENYAIHLDELAEFIHDELQNSMALVPTSLRWNGTHLSMFESLTYNFREKYGEIDATTQLENKIALLQKTRIGAKFPEVNLPSKDGELIALNAGTSELTLIDFWGSWCPPCRVESPLLNELYNSYDRAEFNIYGISLDFKREMWEAALEQDNRIWENVSELKGLATPIAAEMGITALPFNFLLNKEGEIVASNIHGEKLKKFVLDYLEKTKSL